jgi:hypothetical protein
MKKKKVGRPKSDKVRLHITVSPKIEKVARKMGYSKFFEIVANQYLSEK